MTVLQGWLVILGCCAFCLLVLGPICDQLVDWLEEHCAFYKRLGEAPTRETRSPLSGRDAENDVLSRASEGSGCYEHRGVDGDTHAHRVGRQTEHGNAKRSTTTREASTAGEAGAGTGKEETPLHHNGLRGWRRTFHAQSRSEEMARGRDVEQSKQSIRIASISSCRTLLTHPDGEPILKVAEQARRPLYEAEAGSEPADALSYFIIAFPVGVRRRHGH